MEQQTDSSAANAGANPGDEVFTMSGDDLDELDVIYQSLLLASTQKEPKGLFRLAHRVKHIAVRTRGLLEEI